MITVYENQNIHKTLIIIVSTIAMIIAIPTVIGTLMLIIV